MNKEGRGGREGGGGEEGIFVVVELDEVKLAIQRTHYND